MANPNLSEAVTQRRRELGLRQIDLAEQAGVNQETIRRLCQPDRPPAARVTPVEARIEKVLGWAPGSINTIRNGGEPTPAPTTPPAGGRRIVLVQPGDVLILGNVTLPADGPALQAFTAALGTLKTTLGLAHDILVFEDDIDLAVKPQEAE